MNYPQWQNFCEDLEQRQVWNRQLCYRSISCCFPSPPHPVIGLYDLYNCYPKDLCALESKHFLSVQQCIGWLLTIIPLSLSRKPGNNLTLAECHLHQTCFVHSTGCTEHSGETTFPQHQVVARGSSPVTERVSGWSAHPRNGSCPS